MQTEEAGSQSQTPDPLGHSRAWRKAGVGPGTQHPYAGGRPISLSPREPGSVPVLQLQQPLIPGRTASGLGSLGPHLLGARREPPRACGAVSQNGPLPPGPRGLGTQLPDSSTETSPAWEPCRLCVPVWLSLGVSRLSAEPWTKHLHDGVPAASRVHTASILGAQ